MKYSKDYTPYILVYLVAALLFVYLYMKLPRIKIVDMPKVQAQSKVAQDMMVELTQLQDQWLAETKPLKDELQTKKSAIEFVPDKGALTEAIADLQARISVLDSEYQARYDQRKKAMDAEFRAKFEKACDQSGYDLLLTSAYRYEDRYDASEKIAELIDAQ